MFVKQYWAKVLNDLQEVLVVDHLALLIQMLLSVLYC
jgi:hypothetical protein